MSSSDDNVSGSHGATKNCLDASQVRAELTGVRLARELSAELDVAVDAIEDATVRRLAFARRMALAEASGKRRIRFSCTPWATASLAVLLLVVLLWIEPLEHIADALGCIRCCQHDCTPPLSSIE